MGYDKDIKRKEAEARNALWATLSPLEQLKHLDKLSLVAAKQRAKIAKKLIA